MFEGTIFEGGGTVGARDDGVIVLIGIVLSKMPGLIALMVLGLILMVVWSLDRLWGNPCRHLEASCGIGSIPRWS